MIHYQRNVRLALFLMLPILGFMLGWFLSIKNSDTTQTTVSVKIEEKLIETGSEINKIIAKRKDPKDVDLALFWETWGYLEESFLNKESFDTQKQIYGAAKGLVKSLEDPYTVFLDPEETKNFEESLSGEFEGIGAEIGLRNDQLVIITPLKGSPAKSSGILAGDVIFKINGDLTYGISIEAAVTKIRGPKGEKVELTVLREDENEPLEISIVRDTIIIENVEWEMKEEIAVIEISQFGTDVVKEFREGMVEMLLDKPEGIVIDMRNNGGGLLDACVKIVAEFLDRKLIVQTKGRRFGDSGDIMSGDDGAFLDIPLVILINKGSASASEIFAGAIQDHDRGVLIGEKSFGKGSVQNVIPLSDGSSLKVTIAEWLTPNGLSIHEKGIEPDEEVEMTREDYEEDRDPVMDRAMEILEKEEVDYILANKKEKEVEVAEEVIEDTKEDLVGDEEEVEDLEPVLE